MAALPAPLAYAEFSELSDDIVGTFWQADLAGQVQGRGPYRLIARCYGNQTEVYIEPAMKVDRLGLVTRFFYHPSGERFHAYEATPNGIPTSYNFDYGKIASTFWQSVAVNGLMLKFSDPIPFLRSLVKAKMFTYQGCYGLKRPGHGRWLPYSAQLFRGYRKTGYSVQLAPLTVEPS